MMQEHHTRNHLGSCLRPFKIQKHH